MARASRQRTVRPDGIGTTRWQRPLGICRVTFSPLGLPPHGSRRGRGPGVVHRDHVDPVRRLLVAVEQDHPGPRPDHKPGSRLSAEIASSTSRCACGATTTCATQASSSSGVPSPRAAWARPSCVRSHAPGVASRISVMRAASGSASSSAVARSERARVPSCTCVRSASLASFPACLSSRVTLMRFADVAIQATVHDSARFVCMAKAGRAVSVAWALRRSFEIGLGRPSPVER